MNTNSGSRPKRSLADAIVAYKRILKQGREAVMFDLLDMYVSDIASRDPLDMYVSDTASRDLLDMCVSDIASRDLRLREGER